MKKFLNDETLLIVVIGLCLGMVLFASSIGFSAALGAFVMGSILAETIEVKRIEHILEPIKNLFGAVFFVSVGMLLNPYALSNSFGLIILFTIIVLVGRIIFASLGVMASGQSLKVSVRAGFSLAQIGEFSFIIAALGISLNVMSEKLYSIIVAVSVITTFTTPYCIKLSPVVADFLEKKIPEKWQSLVKGYAAPNYKIENVQNDWKKLLESTLVSIGIYATISIGIILLFQKFITPFILEHIFGIWGALIAAIIALLCMSPFIRAIAMKKIKSQEFKNLWSNNYFNRWLLISYTILRFSICIILVLLVLVPLFPKAVLPIIIATLAFLVIIILTQGVKRQSRKLEAHFMGNLNEKKIYEENRAAILPTVANDLLSKDIHIKEVELSHQSPCIGKNLEELNIRQNTGVNVITIIRGNKKINIPDRNERLYPFDRIVVSGSDEEIQKFISFVKDIEDEIGIDENIEHHISLSQYIIEENSPMTGKTIMELNIREKTECMIIGIDRNGESIISFNSSFTFKKEDILWIAGEKDKLRHFGENISAN